VKAFLKSRLYVPVNAVTEKQLDKFTYYLEDPKCLKCKEKPDGCVDCPLSEALEFKTYNRCKGYYAFCRGNLGKIYKTFHQLDIQDQTSAPSFSHELEFTSNLWENQQKTVADWMQYKYGMIKSAPRSGKTVMSVFLICALGVKTLVLTHQYDLLTQFLNTFHKHTNLEALRRKHRTKKIVDLTNCRDDLSQYDVCLTTYQSFISAKGTENLRRIKDNFGLVVVDECFPKDVEVMVDYDKYMSIKDIVENPNITHVLSYDLNSKQIIKKRIIARSKNLNYDGWVDMHLENESALRSSKTHKIISSTTEEIQAQNMKGKECISHNCSIKVNDVTVPVKSKHIPHKYNLEIEDTHNYFVLAKGPKGNRIRTPILVSNCHLAAAECFRKVVDKLNTKHRLGLSATPQRKDRLDFLTHDIIGPITSEGKAEEMKCIVHTHKTGFKILPFRSWVTFESRLVGNKRRNNLICNQIAKDVEAGRMVLAVTPRKKHIDELYRLLTDKGLKVATFDGRVPKNKREELLNKIRTGKYDVLVAIRKMIKLGIDIPLLDTYYYIMPIAYDANYYQEMSRIRTPYPEDLEKELGHGKPVPIIRVFEDFGHGAIYACLNIAKREHKKYKFIFAGNIKEPELAVEKLSGW